MKQSGPGASGLILDKSYLQGAPQDQVRKLCADHLVLMPDVLLLELLSAKESERITCFRKLPEGENPVALLAGIGELMRYESAHLKSCTPLYDRRLMARFVFNESLRQPALKLKEHEMRALEEWETRTRERLPHLKATLTAVDGFFPELKGLAPGEKPELVSKLKKGVAEDAEMVRSIYSVVRHPDFPPKKIIGPDWVFFRWQQVYLLGAIDYRHRYGDNVHEPALEKFLNESLDFEYTITAALEGALASRDLDMISRFKLLRPDGVLIS